MTLELLIQDPPSPTKRPPLLFIHGGFHGAWCWEEHFLPWFSEHGWAVRALSLRGHGRSDGREKLQQASLDDYLNDVFQVLDQWGEPAVLIGHSMGGVLAQRAFERRNDIAGMALLASSPLRPSPGVVLRMLRLQPWNLLAGQLLKDPRRIRMAMESFFFSPELGPDLREKYRSRIGDESFLAMKEIFSRPEPDSNPASNGPVVVVAGRDDWSIPLRDHEQLSRHYGATLEVVPGYHDLMLDPEWEAGAGVIKAWLERHFGSEA